MILNNLVFCIDENKKFVNGSIPSGKITANDINSNFLYVITPSPIKTLIKASFQNEMQNETPETVPLEYVGDRIRVDELVPKTAQYYNMVKDWNVFVSGTPAKALEMISYSRAGTIGVSFNFTELVIPQAPGGYNYIADITNPDYIPNEVGYYVVKVAVYEFGGVEFTYNDILIKTSTGVMKRSALTVVKNTNTLRYSIDPSIYTQNFETPEQNIVDLILLSISDVNQRIDEHIEDLDNPHGVTAEQVDTYVKTTIDNKDADTLQQAKDYTYSQAEIDNKDANTLQEAKDYTDSELVSVKGRITQNETDILSNKGRLSANEQSINNLDNDKVDKLLTIIGLDLQNNILIDEFRIALGNATQVFAGLMSAEDKAHLDGLMSLFAEDADSTVNTIAEVLAIFNNYPEGADLVTVLAGKVDKVDGKQLSTNDLTDVLKNYYDTAYAHSQVTGANPHKMTYAQLLNKPTTIEQAGILNVYNKEYIDTLKDKNGWQSELLGTLSNNETIALSIINQYDEIQMYAKDTLGVIDNENIRPNLMQSGDSVYFFDDTQAFITFDTVFGFTAPVGYTLQVVGLKYTDFTAEEVSTNEVGVSVQDKLDKIDLEVRQVGKTTIQRNVDGMVIKVTNPTVVSTPLYVDEKLVSLNETYSDGKSYVTTLNRLPDGTLVSINKQEVL